MRAKLNLHKVGGTVEIDGHDITKAVRSVTVSAAAGEPSVMTLEMAVWEAAEIDGEVTVEVPDAVRDALLKVGWTAPVVAFEETP